MKVLGFTASTENISVVGIGEAGKAEALLIDKNHVNYQKVLDKLTVKDYEGLYELMTYKGMIEACINEDDSDVSRDFKVINGVMHYKKRPLDNALGEKLLEELKNGFSVESWFHFAKKVLQNPSATAVKELCLFIQAGNIALCENGNFLAYKKVRSNFYDIHSDLS